MSEDKDALENELIEARHQQHLAEDKAEAAERENILLKADLAILQGAWINYRNACTNVMPSPPSREERERYAWQTLERLMPPPEACKENTK